jgi:hypothetical protein
MTEEEIHEVVVGALECFQKAVEDTTRIQREMLKISKYLLNDIAFIASDIRGISIWTCMECGIKSHDPDYRPPHKEDCKIKLLLDQAEKLLEVKE